MELATIDLEITLDDHLEAEMRRHGPAQKGVSFPKSLFLEGPGRERVRAFDAAYDLACRTLGMHFVEVLDEGDHLRFLPSF